MKALIALSLASGFLLAASVAATSYGAVLTPSAGSTRKVPTERAPKPPVVTYREDEDSRRDNRPYRPPVVLLPKGKSTPAYDRYVEREFKRDPGGGYQGYRRNAPQKPWKGGALRPGI